jgi:hypothetical protein
MIKLLTLRIKVGGLWDTPRTRARSPVILPQHLPPSMIKLLMVRIKVGGLVGYSSYQGREPRNSAITPPSWHDKIINVENKGGRTGGILLVPGQGAQEFCHNTSLLA